MKGIEPEFDAIRRFEGDFLSFNLDALSQEGRQTVIGALVERLGDRGRVRTMLHSIAFGNLRLMAPLTESFGETGARDRGLLAEKLGVDPERLAEAVNAAFSSDDARSLVHLANPPPYDAKAVLEDEDFERTVYSMGTSLATWTREVFAAGLFAGDARVLAMTSEGNEVAWRGYAAVAAAKVALESVSRAIAAEYAPHGIRSNVVQAGGDRIGGPAADPRQRTPESLRLPAQPLRAADHGRGGCGRHLSAEHGRGALDQRHHRPGRRRRAYRRIGCRATAFYHGGE